MKTWAACLVLIFASISAHAFLDLLEFSTIIPPQNVFAATCRYEFDRNSNYVTVEGPDGQKSQCSYSHSEITPPDAYLPTSKTYIYHYMCTDSTSAKYSADWMGRVLMFTYMPEPGSEVRCP